MNSSLFSYLVRVFSAAVAMTGLVTGLAERASATSLPGLSLEKFASQEFSPNRTELLALHSSPQTRFSTIAQLTPSPDSPTERSDDAFTYLNRGLERAASGDYAGAIDQFTQAIELDPDFAPAYGSRGLVRAASGDMEGAILDYSRAIELDPNDAIAYGGRGVAHAETGEYEAALEDLSRSIELDPTFALTYYNRGIARTEVDDHEGAVADFTRTLELETNFAPAYVSRGLARSELGDREGAITDLQKAAEIFESMGNTEAQQRALEELERLE
ncbi:tetratricopeptide repeat protein [Thermocoleostomius sinensis]|uniref:Tetratricopeptide repeat protein n=1 Tax=Thermocoleostomius sinensis A174 TaxID=2016057 RepID=A0A9E9C8K1_9CYAN|nr:tetratricopeptide repeat protein [Thermocoleostomius sinensis]WAL60393.1 tetratricopeptide repeat protein [Thermocoleostomius sinensis A174]